MYNPLNGDVMSANYLFPTLDTDGWANTSIKVADYMLSHFFLSDHAQTAFFTGDVYSFAWILQQNQGQIDRIREETQSSLSTYFSKMFSQVDVQVADVANPDSINQKIISLYLVFTDTEGVSYNLSRLVKHTDMKVNEVIAVSNGA